jgi:hypothetical protein
MTEYSTKTYVMQWVLSAHVDQSEKLQRHNMFQIFFVVKDCRVRTIIDEGSCNNLVSVDFVTKICSMTRAHTHPYYIQWLNNSGKAKVIHTTRAHFSIGTYHDSIAMLYRCKHILFCWVALESLILMLFTMVELINILSCTRQRKLLYFLLH